jgi:signal transduction histidine kinase
VFRIVHSLLSSEAKEKQLQFVVDVDNNIPVVMVDAILLQQVLTNLASNAIKFTVSGRITLAACMTGEQHWRISVTDTGPGVPASKRSEIFNEFFQGDAPTVYDRPHQGNGLGLSIVKGLSKQMGGKLALKSVEGEGSTFSIVFPLIFPKETTRRRNKHG